MLLKNVYDKNSPLTLWLKLSTENKDESLICGKKITSCLAIIFSPCIVRGEIDKIYKTV